MPVWNTAYPEECLISPGLSMCEVHISTTYVDMVDGKDDVTTVHAMKTLDIGTYTFATNGIVISYPTQWICPRRKRLQFHL
jgi:hypothetical protein